MCLAIYKPKTSKFPSKATLKTAWENNPHGAGLAIITGNEVKIIKGLMTFDELILVIESGLFNDNEVVIHLRWSTSGSIIPELTHPFPVSRDNKDLMSLEIETDKAVIHNGVMFSPKINDYSDTAIFTKFLALKSNITDDEIKSIIKNDRLAIVTKDGVNLYGNWEIIDGLFYSNTYSLKTSYSWSYKSNKKNKKASFEIDEYYSIPESENFDRYFYDSRYDYLDHNGLDYCPHCDSGNTEIIGINSHVMECLDCGSVYNETDFLIVGDFEPMENESKVLKLNKNKGGLK